MELSPDVLAFARAHHGLVTLTAWRAAGHADSTFRRAVRRDQLQPVTRGVAALPGTTIGHVHEVAAAALVLGPGVLVASRTGSWLWGTPIEPRRPVELITTRRDQRTNLPGVVIHHPDDRATLRPRYRQGLPVTAPLRTLLDVGASDPTAVGPTLEAFVRAGLLTVPAVVAALERRRRRGRPGVRALESALRELGAVVTDSELENRMRRLLRRTGIAGWTFHEVVEGYEVDFCFREHRVIVEVDGYLVHGAVRRQWERDLDRDGHLEALGWLIHRISWRMLTHRSDGCADRLRRILLARSSF